MPLCRNPCGENSACRNRNGTASAGLTKSFQIPIQAGRQDRIAVMNEEPALTITRQGSTKLLSRPRCRWLRSYVAVQYFPGSHLYGYEHVALEIAPLTVTRKSQATIDCA
jgi:hypothetical protein